MLSKKEEIKAVKAEIDNINELWARELKEIVSVKGFNPDSRKGKRAFDELARKFAPQMKELSDKLFNLEQKDG